MNIFDIKFTDGTHEAIWADWFQIDDGHLRLFRSDSGLLIVYAAGQWRSLCDGLVTSPHQMPVEATCVNAPKQAGVPG